MGRSTPSDSAISLICKTFNVNISWLKSGEGKMFSPQSREDALIDRLNEIMANEDARLQKAVLNALLNMDNEGWHIMDKFLTGIIKNIDSN